MALKSECDSLQDTITQKKAEAKLEDIAHAQELKETNNQLISIEIEVSKLI